MTKFAIFLNELMPGLKQRLPPTDSRLRPDQYALEQGIFDQVNLALSALPCQPCLVKYSHADQHWLLEMLAEGHCRSMLTARCAVSCQACQVSRQPADVIIAAHRQMLRRRGWRSSREQSGKLRSRTMTLWKLAGLRRCLTVLLERQQCFTTKAVTGKHARLATGAAAVTSLAHQYDNGRAAVVPQMYMMMARPSFVSSQLCQCSAFKLLKTTAALVRHLSVQQGLLPCWSGKV